MELFEALIASEDSGALPCGWWRAGRRGGGGTAAGWPRAEGAPPRTWAPTLPSSLVIVIIISII